MYNEYEKENKKDYSLLKKFLMNLILIVIFILLLIWLVPWPNMSGLGGLAPLQEQIFSNNIERMKEAAITYYTTERLPQNVGDKKTLTLEQMLDLHLLVPFVDKNGNTCSLTESYVTIEKVDHDEYNYVMKVNLKCSDKEDYVMVYLGCYSYCEGVLCEKKEDSKEPTSTPKPTTSPKPTKTPTTKPTTKPTLSPTPTTKPTTKPTLSPTPTTKPTTKPTTTPTATPTTKPTTTPTTKPTTKPTTTPTATPTPTPTPVVEYEYQYKKKVTTDAVYSAWSAWNYWSYNDNDIINWNSTPTYQIEDLGAKKVQVATQINTAVVERDVQTKVMTKEYKVCTSYKYEADATKVYKIVSDWAYTDEYYKGYNPPADTMTSRWILQDYKVNACEGTCTNHVYLVYRQQTRKVETYTDYTNITASCDNVETRNVDFYITTKDVETLETKVPIYGYKKYYRDRTRKLITAATTTFEYTWSKSENDPELIAAGWVATGEKQQIK